ncbi:hypothetical protein [Candidatus Sororendozoicomonas aggregata]|uniref:hypothetical protein n=1 Tax=Candidatus Sororendozoicomonas aggregata TaxID=3073239 RepID=UPI002ED0A8E2
MAKIKINIMIKFESENGFVSVFFESSCGNSVEVTFCDEFFFTDPETKIMSLSEAEKLQNDLKEEGFVKTTT